MSRTTGPVVAMGAITFANQAVLGDAPDDLKLGVRVAVGTAIVAGGLNVAERVSERGAVALAWLALGTVLLARINDQPSPAERTLAWWNKTGVRIT